MPPREEFSLKAPQLFWVAVLVLVVVGLTLYLTKHDQCLVSQETATVTAK